MSAWALPQRAQLVGTCLGAAVAFAPFELLQTVPVGPVAVTTSEAYLAVALLVAVGLAALDGRLAPAALRQRLHTPLQRLAALGLLLWPAVHIASALWSAEPAASAKFGLRVASGVALAVAVWLWADAAAFRQRLVASLATGSVVLTALAVAERVLGRKLEPWLVLFRDEPTWMLGEQRLATVFDHANIFAAWFELTLPLTVVLAACAKRWVRVGWLALLAVQAVLLSLTYSRAGLGAAVVGAFLLAVGAVVRQRKRLALVAVGLAVVVVGAYLLNPDMRARVGLDERSYRLHVDALQPCRGPAGSTVDLPLRIHNRGTWPLSNEQAPGQVLARLLSARGQKIGQPWLTAPLPELLPGNSAEVVLRVPLPALPTRYSLAVDVERDHVIRVSSVTGYISWFACAALPPGSGTGTGGVGTGQISRPAGADESIGQLRPRDLERKHYWRAAVLLMHERPWLGRGADQFRVASRSYLPPDAHDTRARAHSLWLETWTGLGLLGVVVLLVWLLPLLRAVHLAVLGPSVVPAGKLASWHLSLAAAAGLAGFLVHSQVDHFLAYGKLAPLFWAMVGLLLATAGGWPWPHKTLRSLLNRSKAPPQ